MTRLASPLDHPLAPIHAQTAVGLCPNVPVPCVPRVAGAACVAAGGVAPGGGGIVSAVGLDAVNGRSVACTTVVAGAIGGAGLGARDSSNVLNRASTSALEMILAGIVGSPVINDAMIRWCPVTTV